MKLVNNINYLKQKSNLSWEKLAKILEINLKTLESYYLKPLNSEINPKLNILIKFKIYFNISLDDLVFKDLSEQN